MAEHTNPKILTGMNGEGWTGLETPLLKTFVGYRVGAVYPTLTGAPRTLPDNSDKVHDEDQNPGLSFTPTATTVSNTPSTIEATQANQAKTSGTKRSKCPAGFENYTSVEYISTTDDNPLYHPGTPAWSASNTPQGPIVFPRRFPDPAFNSLNEYWGINGEPSPGNGRPLGLIGQAEDSDRKSEPYCLDDRETWEDDTVIECESSGEDQEDGNLFEHDDHKDVPESDENGDSVEDEGSFENNSYASPFSDQDDPNAFDEEAQSVGVIRRRRRFICGSCGEAAYYDLSHLEDESSGVGRGANVVLLCGFCAGVRRREIVDRGKDDVRESLLYGAHGRDWNDVV